MKVIVNNMNDLTDGLRIRIVDQFIKKNDKPILDVIEMRFVNKNGKVMEIFARDNLINHKCIFITYPEYLLISTILQMVDKKLRTRKLSNRDKMRLWMYKADEDRFIRLDNVVLM